MIWHGAREPHSGGASLHPTGSPALPAGSAPDRARARPPAPGRRIAGGDRAPAAATPGGPSRPRDRFDPFQLRLVGEATGDSHRHLARFYRYAPREFFHFSYEVATEEDILPEQLKTGVFAEILSYQRPDWPRDFFRVHLFDHPILGALGSRSEVPALYPFVLYILTHELIHVSRLSRIDLQDALPAERRREEETVHRLTREVLAPAASPGLRQVTELYRGDSPA